ncbi:hypothetical protein [Companilactobacillus sp.]|uniref:hypothetical protein n=1 Tax=Companilactobacillus sp. TaxID=2767905 RepID=UPI0026244893|nr:hypothetical protein [Companilactobacillus sp.]
MYALIGAKTGTEYTRYKYKEYLYRLLIQEWPTKSSGVRKGKSSGSAMLENCMPEPMRIIEIK